MARRGGERGVCGSLLGQGVCVTLSLCEGRARGPAYARARVWQSLCKYVQRGWGWSSARGSGLLRGAFALGQPRMDCVCGSVSPMAPPAGVWPPLQ